MRIREVFIDGIKCNIYQIEYKGIFFEIGDYHLCNFVEMAEEKGIYFEKEVEEDGQIKTISTIDEDIYCYLSQYIHCPTEELIIDNVKEILEDYFD